MTKRELANSIFNANIPMIAEKGSKEFRKTVLEAIEAETGVARAASAAMYNFAKKAALKAGLVEEFGRAYQAKPRKAKEPKVVDITVPTVTVETEVTVAAKTGADWLVVKDDGEVVGFYKTRAEARAAKVEGSTVEKA